MALSPQQLRDLDAWLAIYTAGAGDLDNRTVAATWAAYQDVTDWLDPAQTLAAASAAVVAMQTARAMHVGLMDEYVAVVVDIMTGQRISTPRVSPVPAYSRSLPAFDVYSRPVFAVRDAIAAGLAEDAALLEAEIRAETISLTDAALARRDAALAALEQAEQAVRYRRVIRPELSATGTCGLCVAAATRVYTIGDLMPIHSRCRCTVMPIVDGADPASDFNIADLERIYAAIPGTTKPDLVKTRIKTIDDVELGPVLAPAA